MSADVKTGSGWRIDSFKVNNPRQRNCFILYLGGVELLRIGCVVDDAVHSCLDILRASNRIEVNRQCDPSVSERGKAATPNRDSVVITKPHFAVDRKAAIKFFFESKRHDGLAPVDKKGGTVWRGRVASIITMQGRKRGHVSEITPSDVFVKEVAW